jgi:hypothetical protein
VRCVVVSSPGVAPRDHVGAAHWSHGFAQSLAARLRESADAVVWFAPLRAGQHELESPPGVDARFLRLPGRPPLHRVAADLADPMLERQLSLELRVRPADIVVHVGAGARGSPNIAWLAARMGSAPFAVVRADEVVCHRGDRIDTTRSRCEQFLDAERCRRCCTGGWLRRPAADEFPSRSDLLIGSLLGCETVFVEAPADVPALVAFGLPERSLAVVLDATAIAERLRVVAAAR